MGRFAFVCGVRALPIIGYKKTLDCFKKEKLKVHLYALLYALDLSYSLSNRYSNRVAYTAYAANAPFAAAHAASDNAVFAAAYAAACAAYAAYADSSFTAAFSAASAAASAADATSKAAINYEIKKVIREDIITIGTNKRIEHADIAVYGDVWDSFMHTLEECDCAYWVDLYQELFRNHFEFDKKELVRRLKICDRFKDVGASAAGEHLLSTRKASRVKSKKMQKSY
jgi:hypothetical protein